MKRIRFKSLFIGMLWLSLVTTSVQAIDAVVPTWEAGLAAYNNKDYAKAVTIWKPLATKGNAQAQTLLGGFYSIGLGVERNLEQALLYYVAAGRQGISSAQFNAAEMYAKGEGVKKDQATAVAWYRLAAQQGDVKAQNTLGQHYAKGLGTDKNEEEAVYWYEKAAAQGYASAQFNLGLMSMEGRGVDQDDTQALHYFKVSAENGYPLAMRLMSDAYTKGWFGLPRDPQKAAYWQNQQKPHNEAKQQTK